MLYSNFSGRGGGDDDGAQGAKEAPDTLVAKQYLRIVDMISEGPVEGLNNGLQSIYIAGTPIQNPDGTLNVDGFNVQGRSGTLDQTYIKGFEESESEKSVGVKVTKVTPVTRTLELAEANSVRVSISIPALQSIDTNTGDASPTELQLAIEIQNNGGGFVPQIIGLAKVGTGLDFFTKPSIPVLSMSRGAEKVGVAVKWVGSTSPELQTIEFNVQRAPYGTSTWTTVATKVFQGKAILETAFNGSNSPYVEKVYTRPMEVFTFYDMTYKSQYDYRYVVVSKTNTVDPQWDTDLCTAWDESTIDTINGKCTSKYVKSYRLALSGSGPFDVRVKRISDDSSSTYLQNDLHWETFTEIVDGKFTYPYTAYVAMSVDASQYSGIPERAYDVKGLIVDVPINYDPILKTYTGIWNGVSFKRAYTDNPAWCLRDLITNNRYGIGDYVSADSISNAAFYKVAKYCDEQVPDGFGGYEPRYTCSLYIQGREEAFKVLKDMASIFGGMLYWSSGNIFAVTDKKEDPSWLFTNANVIDGEFTYQGSSKNARHTAALVTYVDSRDRYQEKVEYVEDSEAVLKFGVKPISVVATGASSRGQAHRLGKNILLSEQYLTEVVSFTTGIEGIGSGLAPGSVIKVADANRSGKRYGGRILSADANSVTLDSFVDVIDGASYTLYYLTQDGVFQEKSITFAASTTSLMALGDGTTYLGISVPIIDADGEAIGALIQQESSTIINFTSPVTDIPQRMSVWVLSCNTLQAQTFRVVSIKESEKCEYIISALAYNESKFDAVDLGTDFHEVPITVAERWRVPAPTGVTFSEDLYVGESGEVLIRVYVNVDKPTYDLFKNHRLYWRYTDGEWTEMPDYQLEFTSFAPVSPKEIEVSVEAVNTYGVRSYKTFAKYTPQGDDPSIPVPVEPTVYATADVYGNITKARVKVKFDKSATDMNFEGKIGGLLLFVANFPYENWADVSSGGTTDTLRLSATSVLQSNTITVLAGSTVYRIVVRPPENPFDPNVNHGGRFWAKLPGGEWRKCSGVDATAVLFDIPHDVTPTTGMVMDWAEISWADQRTGLSKMAVLADITNPSTFEVLYWDSLEQDGALGPLYLAGCQRGREGTSVMNADGKRLHYYPAPGVGTKVIRFPVECFTNSGDLEFTGETDIDLNLPAGSFTTVSAAVYVTKPTGNYARSHIVPVSFGGAM